MKLKKEENSGTEIETLLKCSTLPLAPFIMTQHFYNVAAITKCTERHFLNIMIIIYQT